MPEIKAALNQAKIDLILHDRPEDIALRPLATAGFFGFWEKMRKLHKEDWQPLHPSDQSSESNLINSLSRYIAA